MNNNDEKRIWGIHTQDSGLFLKECVVAIGWKEMGDLSRLEANRESFKEYYQNVYGNAKKGSIASGVGMLYRFIHEIKIGDYIVYPSKHNRQVNIGEIIGDYYYNETSEEYAQQRKVKWLKHLPRTSFSQGALYELGSAMSLFSIKNYSHEYIDILSKQSKKSEDHIDDSDEIIAMTAYETKEVTKDFIIKELSRKLKGYEFEFFIEDLLNAMGYRTIISKQGGDSGIDITAYKDELPPRILVQVKSHDGNVKESTLQSLKGAMKEGDYGLFITLSNYTKNAQKYLDSTPIIRGINGSDLADLILVYYEELSEKYKKIIPLKTVYIPISKDNL